MNLLIHFLGFSSPFTSSLPLIVPMCLLLHSLGFLGPFTPSLPLLILVGLLTINPVISACWACFLISLLFSLSHFFYIVGASFVVGSFVKSGHQQSSKPLRRNQMIVKIERMLFSTNKIFKRLKKIK